MTKKESLDVIKQRVNTIKLNTKIGSRRIADEENAVLLDHIEYNLNNLCELIERDTPMKPLIDKLDLWAEHKCPVCESTVWEVHVHKDENFCSNCGQRLDWSEYNE